MASFVCPIYAEINQCNFCYCYIYITVIYFQNKLYKLPSIHAVKIYELLVQHVSLHYSTGNTKLLTSGADIRKKVTHLLLPYKAEIKYSIYSSISRTRV